MTSEIRASLAILRSILRTAHDAHDTIQVRVVDLERVLAGLASWTDLTPGFGWALAKMEDGCFVRRRGWPADRDLRLALEHEVYVAPDQSRPSVILVQRDGVEPPHIEIEDVLAYDWELAKLSRRN